VKKIVDTFFDLTASSSVLIECSLRVRHTSGRLVIRAQAYRDIDALPIYSFPDKNYIYFKEQLREESFRDVAVAFSVRSSTDRWELDFILHPLPLLNMYSIYYVRGLKLDIKGELKAINEAESTWFSAFNKGE